MSELFFILSTRILVARPPEPRVEAVTGAPGEPAVSRRVLALKPKAFKSRSPLAAGNAQGDNGPRAEELLKHMQGGSLGLGGVAQLWNGSGPPPDGVSAAPSATAAAPSDPTVVPVPPGDSAPTPTTATPTSTPTPTVTPVPPETQEAPSNEPAGASAPESAPAAESSAQN